MRHNLFKSGPNSESTTETWSRIVKMINCDDGCVIYDGTFAGKSLSEALLFAEHVLPHVLS